MKRILCLALACLLLGAVSTAAMAAGTSEEKDVVVEHITTFRGEYRTEVADGEASAGDITVADIPDGTMTLVVVPMEGTALSWIGDCLRDTPSAAYGIHFLDAQGNRVNANGVTVRIAVTGEDLAVTSVTTSGSSKDLEFEVSGGWVTFTADGSEYYAIDGDTEPVPPHTHEYAKAVTAPTCTEKGYTTYTCACGDSYVADYTDPTGHSFTDYVSDGNASCKADGTETAKCDHSCGKTDTRTDKDSKLDHKYEGGKCILCGASQETPKTGDSGNLFLWAELLILSAMALFFLLFRKQRKKEES